MPAADPAALRPQLAPFRPADDELRSGNGDGFSGVFPADDDQFHFHGRTRKLPTVYPSSSIIPAIGTKNQCNKVLPQVKGIAGPAIGSTGPSHNGFPPERRRGDPPPAFAHWAPRPQRAAGPAFPTKAGPVGRRPRSFRRRPPRPAAPGRPPNAAAGRCRAGARPRGDGAGRCRQSSSRPPARRRRRGAGNRATEKGSELFSTGAGLAEVEK